VRVRRPEADPDSVLICGFDAAEIVGILRSRSELCSADFETDRRCYEWSMAARNPLLGALLVATVAISAASLGGCGRPRGEPLYASTVVVGETVLVRVKHAYVKGDKVVVKTFMQNKTDKPVTIDRDAIALKLSDGSVIPRASGRTTRQNVECVKPPSVWA